MNIRRERWDMAGTNLPVNQRPVIGFRYWHRANVRRFYFVYRPFDKLSEIFMFVIVE